MLSPAQVRISLLQLYYKNKPIYNMSFDTNITSYNNDNDKRSNRNNNNDLDITLFNKSMNYLFLRYPELTMNVSVQNDKLVKTYNKQKFSCLLDNHKDSETIQQIEYTFQNTPFDISNELLVKVLYLQHANKMIFLFSDIIIDGFTILIFFKELSTIYQSLYEKRIPFLQHISPVSISLHSSHLDFWKNKLFSSNQFPVKVKENCSSFDEHRIPFIINNDLLARIRQHLATLQITLFDYFTAMFHLLLYIMTHHKEITIDTLFGNYDQENIGLFNDIVLLPFSFDDPILHSSISDYISLFATNLLQIKNNRISLEYLCHHSKCTNLPNIRIHFEYSNKNTDKFYRFGDAKLESNLYENSSNQIRQLLTFNVCEFQDKIECYFSFKKKCFDNDYVEKMISVFSHLLSCENEKLSTIVNNHSHLFHYYSLLYSEKVDKRLLTYSFAGQYPDITYSEFKNKLDQFT